MASKLREKIFAAQDIKTENVTVEEWGVDIQVKGMTGKARANLMDACMDKKGNMDMEKMYPELLIATCFDPETGEKIFEPADRDMINSKSSGALEKVGKVAMKLSGMDTDALKEATKN